MNKDAWCRAFAEAWMASNPDDDPTFVQNVATRTFEHENLRIDPSESAREHIELRRRLQLASNRASRTLPRG